MQEQNDPCLNQENLICKYSGSRAYLFCSSPTCQLKDSLICLNLSCDCQTKNHKFCSFIRVVNIINRISSQRKKRQNWMNQLIQKTTKIYDDLIQRISIEKEIMLLKLQNFGVSEEGVKIIQKFDEEGGRNISGSLIYNYLFSLGQNNNKQRKYKKMNEERYLKFYNTQIQKIKQLLQKLNKSAINLCVDMPQIQSKIIEQTQQQNTLHSFFSQGQQITEFKKLYRASQENFSTIAFHQKCDFKPNLLILVKTKADKIIGAFTPAEWDRKGIWKNERAKETFLFSISNKQKYPNKLNQFVIGTNPTNGPLFGHANGRYDMYIQDKADVTLNSHFAIGSCYGNQRLTQSTQKQWTEFSGALSGSSILLKQWEVYQVIF